MFDKSIMSLKELNGSKKKIKKNFKLIFYFKLWKPSTCYRFSRTCRIYFVFLYCIDL